MIERLSIFDVSHILGVITYGNMLLLSLSIQAITHPSVAAELACAAAE